MKLATINSKADAVFIILKGEISSFSQSNNVIFKTNERKNFIQWEKS